MQGSPQSTLSPWQSFQIPQRPVVHTFGHWQKPEKQVSPPPHWVLDVHCLHSPLTQKGTFAFLRAHWLSSLQA